MKFVQSNDTYIIKLERGEEVLTALTNFAVTQNITNASFSGIGAVEGLTCGYYNLTEKEYHFTDYDQLVEVVSLTGNMTLKDGQPFIHAHGIFTGTDNQAFGGHIKSMTVGVTLEVVMRTYGTEIARELDEDIGLFLMNCGA